MNNKLYEMIKTYYDTGTTPVQQRISVLLPFLNERQRRIYLACEAQTYGSGGIAEISKISGVSHMTIRKGIQELSNKNIILDVGRSRQSITGSRSIKQRYPNILKDIDTVLGEISKYRHENPLCYTTKRAVGISVALKEKGMDVSASGVHYLLKELGYNLGRNKRNHNISAAEAQFAHINRMANACMKREEAILFIEVKRVDKRWRNRTVVEYNHDYLAEELGKETSSAFYNLFKKQGFVNVGLSDETSRVAIGCMEQWLKTEYFERYHDAKRILVVTDALASERWVSRLQALVNQINKRIEVLYFPQGITKWDNVEHRFYSFIGDDPQEQFVHTAIIGSLIGKGNGTGVTVEYVTNTKAGTGEAESNNLPAGIMDFMEGEWNYTLWPTKRGGIRKTPGLRIEGAEYFQETEEDEEDMDDEEPSDDEEIEGDEEGDKMVNDEKVSNG